MNSSRKEKLNFTIIYQSPDLKLKFDNTIGQDWITIPNRNVGELFEKRYTF